MNTRRKLGRSLFFPGLIFSLLCGAFNFSAPARAGIADHLVINEVGIDSVSGSGGHEDDWVELYNPTASDIGLGGWSLQKANATGGSFYNQALSGTVPAGGYFLVVRDGSGTAQGLKDTADILASNSFLLAEDFSVYLVTNSDDITDINDPDIIDLVGYGTSLNYEGAAAAPDISETNSLSRSPDGEDTDENSVDFVILDTPTPQNSSGGTGDDDNDIGGTVAPTITPDLVPAQNINPTSADIVFQVNTSGTAYINYGLSSTYNTTSASSAFAPNTDTTISLSGLECGTEYHYSIYAENTGGAEYDETPDAVFTTLPCGITVDSLIMTKSSAKANNQYAEGWTWEFAITVWDLSETTLKIKFDVWSGPGSINAADNMQFSVDNSSWYDIDGNGVYPGQSADIGSIDESGAQGRQIKIYVRMKVPVGTLAGYYDSSYGILTE